MKIKKAVAAFFCIWSVIALAMAAPPEVGLSGKNGDSHHADLHISRSFFSGSGHLPQPVSRLSQNPRLASQAGDTGLDTDQDGLDDATELDIAQTYAPLLIFDEDEQEDVSQTLVPLYQVSPVNHRGQDGAMLVFVFLYDNDNGADFDQGWSDWFTDPIDTAAGFIMDPFDQFFGKHCGDTKVIYFFIANMGDWRSTYLQNIFWKRHYDDIYETSEDVVEYDDFGTGGLRTHPIIYVSEDKHGMYPNHDECEDYETDVVADKIKIPLTPKMEDCSGGVRLQISYLPMQWNVGESISANTKNRAALNGSHYAGYDPWENVEFWGRTDIEKLCETPAGGLGGKWCGSPFAGGGHPCARTGWWGARAGSCLDYGADRFGSDYFNFLMDGQDVAPCMQACLNDPNCVSFSYVLPGYQGERGVCYLKNDDPVLYQNPCCISGLRNDCLR